MSKAYPSNLTQAQFELLSDLIPEPKSGGRPRTVDMRDVLNAMFYILVEGVRAPCVTRRFSCLANGVHLFSQLAH